MGTRIAKLHNECGLNHTKLHKECEFDLQNYINFIIDMNTKLHIECGLDFLNYTINVNLNTKLQNNVVWYTELHNKGGLDY